MVRLVVLCALVGLATASAPEQLFVNFGERPDTLWFSWMTASQDASVVQYGTSAQNLSSAVQGPQPKNYTFSLLGSSYTSGYIHHVQATQLQPATQYWYRVGSTAGWSEVHTVTSHPGVGADIPFFWAVVGDLGQTKFSNQTIQHLLAQPKLQGILHAGDLSYSDDDQLKYGAKADREWDTYQALIEPLSSGMPWHTTVGNHEIENPFDPFVAYQARYRMPFDASNPLQQGSLWWSMNVASAHIVFLSSYSPFEEGSDQFQWLTADLASIDKSVTPWTIVLLHAPWYNSNEAHHKEGDAMRDAMEHTLKHAGVDLVFAGHVHAYERHTRVYKKEPDHHGPVYITIGDGGNREGLATHWIDPQPDISLFRQSAYGHGELNIVNASALHWSWHRGEDSEGTVADEVWIYKQ